MNIFAGYFYAYSDTRSWSFLRVNLSFMRIYLSEKDTWNSSATNFQICTLFHVDFMDRPERIYINVLLFADSKCSQSRYTLKISRGYEGFSWKSLNLEPVGVRFEAVCSLERRFYLGSRNEVSW